MMKFTRPRLTVRRLMIVVAVIGALLGAWAEVERRRRRFEELAGDHYILWMILDRATNPRLSDWHLSMSRKYQSAARSPWLPVAPDPPSPNDPGPRSGPAGNHESIR